ncbi:Putative teichuronic acid biosynthesis glycosyltransferase TuaC [Clostridiales bacterium CHKCI001]|nr:Putative teichuronic acid biosynthesis glycosyltransferase TuaC [Clostridiales bacterium CHKCI001]
MKKICFVTTISMTLKAFVLETAKYLHENGEYDISFICNYDKDFAENLPEYIHYYPVSMERGISIGGINAMLEIKKILKREKIQIVQYSTPNASCYTSLAGVLAHIPVRLYCQWGIAYVGFSGIKRKIFKLEEKMVCKLSTWVEPDSFGNLKFSHDEKLYPFKKGSVIWNGSASGVNIRKFNIENKTIWRIEIRKKYNIPEDAKVFIFVGRVTRDKGINELFAATRKLFEKCKDIYLLIVGPNENSGSVNERLYKWSEKNENVIYCGFTNEVEKYLSASDVYVLPSYREGFGSAVIEAESMGVPVIISDIPGPTDAMKKDHTGLIVSKGSTKELAAAMYKLYRDPDLRKEYGNNAYEFAVTNFEQKKLFEKILLDRDKLLKMSVRRSRKR